jgi:hypothetical protein
MVHRLYAQADWHAAPVGIIPRGCRSHAIGRVRSSDRGRWASIHRKRPLCRACAS